MKLLTGLFVFCLLFVSGCTHKEIVKETHNPKPSESQLKYYITGTIDITNSTSHDKLFRVIGESNLKQGTLLSLQYNDESVKKIKTDKKGGFYTSFIKSNVKNGDVITVLLKPDLQPKKLQSIYGKTGKKLTGKYSFSYRENQKQYMGLKAGMIVKSVEGGNTASIPMYSAKVLKEHQQGVLN